MTEYRVVLVTVGKREEADRIASALVEEKLAACCTLIQGVSSLYRWEGRICRDEETLMVIKTGEASFDRLCARVRELHSYKVPEIIALPIAAGHKPYLDWVRDETSP